MKIGFSRDMAHMFFRKTDKTPINYHKIQTAICSNVRQFKIFTILLPLCYKDFLFSFTKLVTVISPDKTLFRTSS